jgi:DNA-binding transcriptional LysR family regulator
LLPSFLVFDDIACGRLQPLLVDHEVQGDLGTALYALHLPGRMSSPKVRALIQHLKRDWPTNAWDAWRVPALAGELRPPV